MPSESTKPIHYKRARFSTYLPQDRLYTPSHFWVMETEPGVWRVGFTKFATRMLGEIVEFQAHSKPGDAVTVGAVIGHIEAFKAVSDIYCIVQGNLHEFNPSLDEDVTLISSFPYDRGWLYQAEGSPDPQSMTVQDYITLLDATIDKLQEQENR